MSGIDYRAALIAARTDEELLATARENWKRIGAEVMSRNHDRDNTKLRVSDAGRCSLELWSQLHDKRDIPEDGENAYLRMDQGSLNGAWAACLVGAALAERGYPSHVEVEMETDEGWPGHADLVVLEHVSLAEQFNLDGTRYELQVIDVVDFKWTASFNIREISDEENRHQAIQVCTYALKLKSPSATIVTSAPVGRDTFGRILAQSFDPEDWAMDVHNEYARLSSALLPSPPMPDPPDAYRCKYCRYSLCAKNKNQFRQLAAARLGSE